MKSVEVNLPEFIYGECLAYGRPAQAERVALEQAVTMYPWLGELLKCLHLACQRDLYLRNSYDLGEPKSEVRERWNREDKKRLDALDYQFHRGVRGVRGVSGKGLMPCRIGTASVGR